MLFEQKWESSLIKQPSYALLGFNLPRWRILLYLHRSCHGQWGIASPSYCRGDLLMKFVSKPTHVKPNHPVDASPMTQYLPPQTTPINLSLNRIYQDELHHCGTQAWKFLSQQRQLPYAFLNWL